MWYIYVREEIRPGLYAGEPAREVSTKQSSPSSTPRPELSTESVTRVSADERSASVTRLTYIPSHSVAAAFASGNYGNCSML